MNNNMNSAYSKKEFIRAYDPDFDGSSEESIYAWNKNRPMIRTKAMMCPSCNYDIPTHNPNDHIGCKNTKCDNCGYSLKMYEYNDLNYDKTKDDADNDDADFYDMNIEQPSDDALIGRGIKRGYPIKNVKEIPEESSNDMQIEYMDGNNESYMMYNVTGLIIFILLLVITYIIASKRGELMHEDGTTNWSLVVCIFFLFQFYWIYAIVDYITSPCHHCA